LRPCERPRRSSIGHREKRDRSAPHRRRHGSGLRSPWRWNRRRTSQRDGLLRACRNALATALARTRIDEQRLLPSVHEAFDAGCEVEVAPLDVRQCANNEDLGRTDFHALRFAFAPTSVDHRSKGAGWLFAIARTGQATCSYGRGASVWHERRPWASQACRRVSARWRGQVPAYPAGLTANHWTMSGMCGSNAPGMDRLRTAAGASVRFSKSWTVPPGTRTNEPWLA
jgi:hypothetical protein